jgi:hypothetical protein
MGILKFRVFLPGLVALLVRIGKIEPSQLIASSATVPGEQALIS